jgi:hypothetical protein
MAPPRRPRPPTVTAELRDFAREYERRQRKVERE